MDYSVVSRTHLSRITVKCVLGVPECCCQAHILYVYNYWLIEAVTCMLGM